MNWISTYISLICTLHFHRQPSAVGHQLRVVGGRTVVMRTAKGPARPTSRLRGPERVSISCFYLMIPVIVAHCLSGEEISNRGEQCHTSLCYHDSLRPRPCFGSLSDSIFITKYLVSLLLIFENICKSQRQALFRAHAKLIVL